MFTFLNLKNQSNLYYPLHYVHNLLHFILECFAKKVEYSGSTEEKQGKREKATQVHSR